MVLSRHQGSSSTSAGDYESCFCVLEVCCLFQSSSLSVLYIEYKACAVLSVVGATLAVLQASLALLIPK